MMLGLVLTLSEERKWLPNNMLSEQSYVEFLWNYLQYKGCLKFFFFLKTQYFYRWNRTHWKEKQKIVDSGRKNGKTMPGFNLLFCWRLHFCSRAYLVNHLNFFIFKCSQQQLKNVHADLSKRLDQSTNIIQEKLPFNDTSMFPSCAS